MLNDFLKSLLDKPLEKEEVTIPLEKDETIDEETKPEPVPRSVPKIVFQKTYCKNCGHSEPYHPRGADGRKFPVSSGVIWCKIGERTMTKLKPFRCRFSTDNWEDSEAF